MAADLLARGLAATARDGALPALRRFADLPARTVPAACDRIEAGSGPARGSYLADALATPALAAAHPRLCKADAAGRVFRFAGAELDIAHAGATGSGNDQPAVQAALSYAAAVGIRRVVNRGLAALSLWEPLQTQTLAQALTPPLGNFYAKRTLQVPACAALDIDFGGATIALKGPSGGARHPGQAVGDGLWLGGFITVTGIIGHLRLANVTVAGGFAGDTYEQADVNLLDKGFMCQDLGAANLGAGNGMGTIEMDNVTLHGFAGEIMYDNSSALHLSRDCHFYNSGHSCWNAAGLGRVVATNLRAGQTRQPAEVLGGAGHDYFGGRFYDGGTAGSTFFGGPQPAFDPAYPYSWSRRADDAAPPFITFHGTRFENFAAYLQMGSWVRGSVVLVDAYINAGYGVGQLQDQELEVECWADRQSNFAVVTVGGPADLVTQAYAAPAGVFYKKPVSLNYRIKCRRTRLARDNARQIGFGLSVSGLIENNCRFRIEGEAKTPFGVNGTVPGFVLPLIESEGLVTTGLPYSDTYDYFAEDRSYVVSYAAMNLFPTAAGTFNASLDNTFGYLNGQRVRFVHGGGGGPGTSDRIVRFAKSGAGMALQADRTLRRAGEYLILEWSAQAGAWAEAAYVGQGA